MDSFSKESQEPDVWGYCGPQMIHSLSLFVFSLLMSRGGLLHFTSLQLEDCLLRVINRLANRICVYSLLYLSFLLPPRGAPYAPSPHKGFFVTDLI